MGGVVKSIKKAVKKVFREIARPIKQVVGADQDVPDVPTPAAVIEAPKEDTADTTDNAQTESGRKKALAGGKRSLSVARSSGSGINI